MLDKQHADKSLFTYFNFNHSSFHGGPVWSFYLSPVSTICEFEMCVVVETWHVVMYVI